MDAVKQNYQATARLAVLNPNFANADWSAEPLSTDMCPYDDCYQVLLETYMMEDGEQKPLEAKWYVALKEQKFQATNREARIYFELKPEPRLQMLQEKVPDDSNTRQALVYVDKALTDCFLQTVEGQHALEIPIRPEVQSSNDNVDDSAAKLVVNACPYEVTTWQEKCEKDSGDDALTCLTEAGNIAEAVIERSNKPVSPVTSPDSELK